MMRPKVTTRFASDNSSNAHNNDIQENDGSLSVPAYVTTLMQSAKTSIFAARKKELHFLSDTFHKECQGWLQDDGDQTDSDDEEYSTC